MKKNRKTKNMQAVFYTVISLMLTAVFVLTAVPKQTEAAEKASLSLTEKTIGVGAYDTTYAWGGEGDSGRNVLTVYNAKKNASYSFVSKNKKIVTVKKKGTNCYITGVKAGKTTITCYQTLNKKKTVVGKCKVEVKNAAGVPQKVNVPLGKDNSLFSEGGHFTFYMSYMNPQASYKFVPNKSGLAIKCKKKSEDGKKWFSLRYTATKAGTYTVTVKETYKKKTRTVEKLKITVCEPEVSGTYEVNVGDTFYPTNPGSIINYPPDEVSINKDDYDFDITDGNNGQAVYVDDQDDYFGFHAIKEGIVTLKFYYGDSVSGKAGDYIGSCTVTVQGAKVKETYEIEIDRYDDGEYDTEIIYVTGELMENTSYGASYEVVGKDFDIKDAENGQAVCMDEDGYLKAVRPGTAEVEIYYWDKDNDKLGEYIGSCIITVTANED